MPTIKENLKAIQLAFDNAHERYHNTCSALDSKKLHIKELQDRLREVDIVLGRIVEWTTEFGEELIPHAPYTDSYGDGVRACKERIQRIIRQ